MKVTIYEKSNKKHIATYPIYEQGLGYKPTKEDSINEAWKCAAEDGLVEDNDKEKYEFVLEN